MIFIGSGRINLQIPNHNERLVDYIWTNYIISAWFNKILQSLCYIWSKNNGFQSFAYKHIILNYSQTMHIIISWLSTYLFFLNNWQHYFNLTVLLRLTPYPLMNSFIQRKIDDFVGL